MADMDAFERVLRVEVQARKKAGQPAPTFGDVKRLIEEKDLFTSDEIKEHKAQLKMKAMEICDEVYSAKEKSKSPQRSPKAPVRKRKAEPAEAEEGGKSKKVKKESEKGSKRKASVKKERDNQSDSDIDMEPKSKATKSSNKRVTSKATIDDDDSEGLQMSKKSHKAARRVPSAVDSDAEVATSPPKSSEAAESSPKEGKKRIPAAEVAELSDGDLSVLEDGTPVKPKKVKGEGKKKRESKEKNTSEKEKPTKGKGKASTTDDPNEQEIKRLKSFVVACGVRKKWAKEFEGIEDKPKKQIAALKSLLENLGMTGRLSLEKAKAIRAKRELAEEIEEVVQFEARRGAESAKSRSRPKKEAVKESDSEDEENLGANPPARKKNPLAFLDDQSDED